MAPCVLPMVPVYLASLAGPELFTVGQSRRRLHLFLHSLSFVIGFGIVFCLLGVAAGLGGFFFTVHLRVVRVISGCFLVAFGLLLLASHWVPWLNYEKRLPSSRATQTGYLRSLLTGAAFALAWTPCVSPVLGGILTMAFSSGTVLQAAYLLAVYSLGLALPFLILGLAFDYLTPRLKGLSRFSGIIYLVSALLLIAVGVLILTSKLVWLQGWW